MITDERELINRMAAGLCDGVQEHSGAHFVPLCITPTGVRWNADAGYFEFRDPAHWLNDNMLARVIGLPVLGGADPGAMDSDDFGRRCIGTVVAAYVDSNSLMCIARIANDYAIRIIESGAYDTRVTVHFNNDAPAIDIDTDKLVIEPPPRYLSHISIVPKDSVEFEYGFAIIHRAFQHQQELRI
jgi:hypothetical protein